MPYVKPPRDAREVIEEEIAAAVRRQDDLENKVRFEQDKIDHLEKLYPYASCKKCGAECTGGIDGVAELMEAALSIGRKDYPCIFCDSPEQTRAMEKALGYEGDDFGVMEREHAARQDDALARQLDRSSVTRDPGREDFHAD